DDSDNLLGFTPRRTMRIAQQLYQGVEIDNTPQALITYMRTDSSRVSPYAMGLARKAFENREDSSGELYKGRPWQPDSAQQDAHEAIRPTMPEDPDFFPENLEGKLEDDFLALYKLIYYRFLASQAKPALYHRTDLTLEGGGHRAEATGFQLLEEGFLRFYREYWPRYAHREVKLPGLKIGDQLNIDRVWPEPEQTYPPPRYREGSLVRELKSKGIGRPSTYGDILQKIKKGRGGFGYVNKTRGKLRPADRGIKLCDYLHNKFPQVIDYSYTAEMEKNLELIEQGKMSYTEFLEKEFVWLKTPYKITRRAGWLSGDLPTPAQVNYLKKLSKEVGKEVPEKVFESKQETSGWIDKLQEKIEPVVEISEIEKVDVSGIPCYRFHLYFNRPLPDEEKEFVKKKKLKYRPGGEERMPSYQFQRQDKQTVAELRQEIIDRYEAENSPLKAEFKIL
ncbi:MAG: DNA topoisomerase, partial [bacterium]